MVVTFRKPKTMADNVRNAIKLFSNEARDWEKLIPREYKEIRIDFTAAHKSFVSARQELKNDPQDLKKRLNVIKTFQTMQKLEEAIKSYEELENDFEELAQISDVIAAEIGHIENEKAAVKEILASQGAGEEEINEALEIEFSYDQRATLEERIDSYYIAQLLKDIKNEESKRKFDEIIKNKPLIIKVAYEEAVASVSDEHEIIDSVDSHFRRNISDIIAKTASILKVPSEDLSISFNEYRRDKAEIPYINIIIDKSELTKEDFESLFNKKFRERRRTVEEYWKRIIEDKLSPLKEELTNFAVEYGKIENIR